MTELIKGILSLVKSAVRGEKIILPDNFDLEKAYEFSKQHNITALMYYGIKNSDIKLPEKLEKKLLSYTFKAVAMQTNQDFEIEKICSLFDENNVAYILLKGAVIRKLYPKPEMRYMSDIDVLIKPEQYKEIKDLIEQKGYEFVIESNHEYIWKKSIINLEFHKILIPSYNKDYFEYYKDGWKNTFRDKDGKYKMSDEDFLIYIITHIAKHYRDSGVGVLHFTDIWIYLSAKPKLDKEYIKDELNKLKLYDFYKNTLNLLDVWFEDKEPDGVSRFMSSWIFSSGAYGTEEKMRISAALKMSDNIRSSEELQKKIYIKKVFLPYHAMSQKYPILKKIPVLLFFLWAIRMADVLLFKRNKIKAEKNNLVSITTKNITDYQKALQYVGLDFDFKEQN